MPKVTWIFLVACLSMFGLLGADLMADGRAGNRGAKGGAHAQKGPRQINRNPVKHNHGRAHFYNNNRYNRWYGGAYYAYPESGYYDSSDDYYDNYYQNPPQNPNPPPQQYGTPYFTPQPQVVSDLPPDLQIQVVGTGLNERFVTFIYGDGTKDQLKVGSNQFNSLITIPYDDNQNLYIVVGDNIQIPTVTPENDSSGNWKWINGQSGFQGYWLWISY